MTLSYIMTCHRTSHTSRMSWKILIHPFIWPFMTIFVSWRKKTLQGLNLKPQVYLCTSYFTSTLYSLLLIDVYRKYWTISGFSSIPGYTNPFAFSLTVIIFQPLDQDVLFPVTVLTITNQKYLNPSGVHHRYNTGCYQRSFVSDDLQQTSSSYPKDYHLWEYKSSMTPPMQRFPSFHDNK